MPRVGTKNGAFVPGEAREQRSSGHTQLPLASLTFNQNFSQLGSLAEGVFGAFGGNRTQVPVQTAGAAALRKALVTYGDPQSQHFWSTTKKTALCLLSLGGLVASAGQLLSPQVRKQ